MVPADVGTSAHDNLLIVLYWAGLGLRWTVERPFAVVAQGLVVLVLWKIYYIIQQQRPKAHSPRSEENGGWSRM